MPTNLNLPPIAPADPNRPVVQISATIMPTKALYGIYVALVACLIMIAAQGWVITAMAKRLGWLG